MNPRWLVMIAVTMVLAGCNREEGPANAGGTDGAANGQTGASSPPSRDALAEVQLGNGLALTGWLPSIRAEGVGETVVLSLSAGGAGLEWVLQAKLPSEEFRNGETEFSLTLTAITPQEDGYAAIQLWSEEDAAADEDDPVVATTGRMRISLGGSAFYAETQDVVPKAIAAVVKAPGYRFECLVEQTDGPGFVSATGDPGHVLTADPEFETPFCKQFADRKPD